MSAQIGGFSLAQAMDGLVTWSTPAPAIGAAEYALRIEHARTMFREAGVDALLLTMDSSVALFRRRAVGCQRAAVYTGVCFSGPMIVGPWRFGLRLADHFHITDDGAAWFTEPSPAIDQPFAN